MLNEHQRNVRVAVFVAIGVVFLSWASTSTASYEICQQERHASHPEQSGYLPEVRYFFICEGVTLDANGMLVTALASVAIALFTLFLKNSTDNLWEAGELQRRDNRRAIFASLHSAKAAQKQARIAEQALVDLESPILYPFICDESVSAAFKTFEIYDHHSSPVSPVEPIVQIQIKNYGRTPAIFRSVQVRMDTAVFLFDADIEDLFSDAATQFIVEPGGITERTFRPKPKVIDKETHAKIKANRTKLFVYGVIWFSDIFGNDWSQTFGLRWDYKLRGFCPDDVAHNRREKSTKTRLVI